MQIFHVFLLFLCYSFIGWAWETALCSTREKRFINRGFLYGPLCPVYGFGGLLIMYLLKPWAHTWIPLFLASMVITSILEYLTSWGMEKLFHARWWDYSSHKFNLNGRIYLGGAFFFGIMGTTVMHFVHPYLVNFLVSLPNAVVTGLAISLGVVLAVDFAFTLRNLVDFASYMTKLRSFVETLRERYATESWYQESSLSELFERIKERIEEGKLKADANLLETMEALKNRQRRHYSFVKRFPSMRSEKFRLGIENLKQQVREEIRQRREERKNKKAY